MVKEELNESGRVFVDSSAFVALNNETDAHARAASQIAAHLADRHIQLITSNFVIAESLTIISQRTKRSQAVAFGLEVEDVTTVIRITLQQEKDAFERFARIRQKDVSFIDCTCFVVCEELGIKDVFTFDTDFAKQGFKLIKS